MGRMYTRWQGAMAAAAVALAVGASACGSGSSSGSGSGSSGGTSASGTADAGGPKRGAKVTMWIMNNGPEPVADTERILKPFEDKTGVDVDVKLVGWDVQLDRIRNAAISGEGPDITQAGTTQVPFFAALGGFEDVSGDVGSIGGKGAYSPGVWGTTQVAGQKGTWAVPWFTETRAIYYRKDALEEAGIDPATAFTDWDTMRATLQRLKEVGEVGGKPIKPFGGPGKKAFDLVHNVAPFIWDAGGDELSADDRTSAIDSPQAVQGVSYYAGLVKDGLADPAALEKDGQGVEDAFKGGDYATFVGGPWVLQSVSRKDDEAWDATARKNIGVAPLPKGPTGKAYSFVGGSNLMLMKTAKDKGSAWAVMQYLSQDAVQKSYAELMGMLPARKAPQEQVGTSSPDRKQFLTAIQDGRSYRPIPQWAQVETAYKDSLGEILDVAAGSGGGALTPQLVQEKLKAAAKEADGLLAQGS